MVKGHINKCNIYLHLYTTPGLLQCPETTQSIKTPIVLEDGPFLFKRVHKALKGGARTLDSYIDTIYFNQNSLKIVQVEGGASVPWIIPKFAHAFTEFDQTLSSMQILYNVLHTFSMVVMNVLNCQTFPLFSGLLGK